MELDPGYQQDAGRDARSPAVCLCGSRVRSYKI